MLQRYSVLVANSPPAQEVSAEYISGDFKQLWYLRQIPYSVQDTHNVLEFPVGNASIVTVTVRGQQGVWVEATNQGAHLTETGEEILVPWNMLPRWGDFLALQQRTASKKPKAAEVVDESRSDAISLERTPSSLQSEGSTMPQKLLFTRT
jgi:hypothetical protein